MEIELVQSTVAWIAPYLPFLLPVGGKIVDTLTGELTKDGFDKAKALWSKLRPNVEASPSFLEAAQDLASTPDDEDIRAAFRVQLKKLLQANPELGKELTDLLESYPPARNVQTVVGNNNALAQEGSTATVTITKDA